MIFLEYIIDNSRQYWLSVREEVAHGQMQLAFAQFVLCQSL